MREAAEVLAPVRDDVIVIGAVAVQVALDGHAVALTPTRDVDGAVKTDRIDAVVAQLKAAELQPSALPHERGFTWVKGDLKVQLLRPYHPFPKGAAKGLPISNLIPETRSIPSPRSVRRPFRGTPLLVGDCGSAGRA